MTIEGVDALGHPTPAALVAAGKHFVCQYLKNTTHANVAAYLAAGIDVVLIGESTGKRSLSGQSAGADDANTYLHQADALGAPDSAAIYLAEIDFDAQSTQLPAILAYYHGASAVLGSRCGAYGGLRAIKALLDARVVRYAWQTYAWSGGNWDARANLQQYRNHAATIGGAVVDFDRAMTTDYGAWSATGDDMSAADVAAINAHTDQVLGRVFASLSHGELPDGTAPNGVGHDQILAAIRGADTAGTGLSAAQVQAIADAAGKAAATAAATAVATQLAKLVLVPKV